MAMATTESSGAHRKWLRRVAWLVGIWAVSVAALAGFSLLVRFLMAYVGLTR